MVSAIGSSSFATPSGAGASAVGLEAQLARYQKVLSECVSCESAKTSEGKQAIQDISSKISDVKARIAEITTAKSGTQQLAHDARTSGDNSANTGPLDSVTRDNTAVAISSAYAPIGGRLDVFA